jgi:A/G-specific adenine glycosylase
MKSDPVSAGALRAFREEIYGHFTRYGRDFPWRKTRDPYCILVSEIMLQQTSVDRVVKKYAEFIAAFPDFHSLHKASLALVFGVWQGLGYNRRALALKRIAETVVDEYGGRLPDSVEKLSQLPGIGRATASSIRVFAFNLPAVFIETNIRTVYIHRFFQTRSKIDDSEIAALVEKTLDKKNPRKWYSALMDYGAMLKKIHPNPSRKSAHYKTQSPFEGSKRQIRGAILRHLLNNPGCGLRQLTKEMKNNDGRLVREILKELQKDGLIVDKRGRFLIA